MAVNNWQKDYLIYQLLYLFFFLVLFILYSASLEIVAEKGDTCLSVACKHSKLEVIDLLLSKGSVVDPKAVYESFKRKSKNDGMLTRLLAKDPKGTLEKMSKKAECFLDNQPSLRL